MQDGANSGIESWSLCPINSCWAQTCNLMSIKITVYDIQGEHLQELLIINHFTWSPWRPLEFHINMLESDTYAGGKGNITSKSGIQSMPVRTMSNICYE